MIRLNTSEHGGGGISEFQWSTSEQVWPFEKDSTGNTLYCKQINVNPTANNGWVSTAHSTSYSKTKTLYGVLRNTSWAGALSAVPLPIAFDGSALNGMIYVGDTFMSLYTNSAYAGALAEIYWVYAK